MSAEISLEGWDIRRFDGAEWAPWGGAHGEARAKVLGAADGFYVALVEAQPGYEGAPHMHTYPEFNYIVEGEVRNQGQLMRRGDAYAAAAGSSHTDFATEAGATYLLVFKI
jgi:uncharacterized cupin superfamily protein